MAEFVVYATTDPQPGQLIRETRVHPLAPERRSIEEYRWDEGCSTESRFTYEVLAEAEPPVPSWTRPTGSDWAPVDGKPRWQARASSGEWLNVLGFDPREDGLVLLGTNGMMSAANVTFRPSPDWVEPSTEPAADLDAWCEFTADTLGLGGSKWAIATLRESLRSLPALVGSTAPEPIAGLPGAFIADRIDAALDAPDNEIGRSSVASLRRIAADLRSGTAVPVSPEGDQE